MTSYLDYLEKIAAEDAAGLKKAEESYGDSWKRRGGVGAFMMLARKWDRLERRVEKARTGLFPGGEAGAYDIFAHLEIDDRIEGLIDDVRDLRRYLMLVEAELRARGAAHGEHRDNVGELPLHRTKEGKLGAKVDPATCEHSWCGDGFDSLYCELCRSNFDPDQGPRPVSGIPSGFRLLEGSIRKCDHKDYGRVCPCGAMMTDFGD